MVHSLNLRFQFYNNNFIFIMNYLKNTFLLFLTMLVFSFCAEPDKSLTISGTIQNGQKQQVFLDQVHLNNTTTVIGKTDADDTGGFSIKYDNEVPLSPGVYRLRVGPKNLMMVLKGTEKNVEVNSSFAGLSRYEVDIKGSDDSKTYAQIMSLLVKRQLDVNRFRVIADTVSNPMVPMHIAYSTMSRPISTFKDVHQKISARMKADYPESMYSRDYENFIAGAIKREAGKNKLKPKPQRQMATDINLPDPSGKNYRLSDLKGKIVLLDFWASWCGPCRRANPHVVELYKKYKDQGFVVYNVSLDKPGAKERWKKAIEKDKLDWPYHVSDLKGWACAPAKAYGVKSIPRTFLLDREGKIAGENFRGDVLEKAIVELMKEI